MSEKPRASIDLAGLSRKIIANVEQVVVGKRQQIIKVLGRVATGVGDRETHNAETKRTTLERIKREAEGSGPTPS